MGTLMHSERIEWSIVKTRAGEVIARHSEGAQTVFGRTRAKKILKALDGAGWEIRRAATLESPDEET